MGHRLLPRAALLGALGALVASVAACGGPAKAPGAAGIPSRPSVAQARDCATGHPATWMGCLMAADPGFGNTEISRLAIPGAHDSGTFDLDERLYDKANGSDCTNYSPVFSYGDLPQVIERWSRTQDLDYTQQLDVGVRYLDVRIAYTGSPSLGWRIVHTQFSSDPLARDLGAIAAWARSHPTEVVIVDVQHLCYDNSPTAAADLQLWQDFAPLAPVSYSPPAGSTVATTTLHAVVSSGRNVIVMLPTYSKQASALHSVDHVNATFVVAPGTAAPAGSPSPLLEEAYAWASTVAPARASDYPSANRALQAFPIAYTPPLGSLQGKGLFQAQLIYSLSGTITDDVSLLSAFGGLIPGPGESDPAWETGLWSSTYDRNEVIAFWGRRLNVVVTDGVEYGGFVAAVVEQNAGP